MHPDASVKLFFASKSVRTAKRWQVTGTRTGRKEADIRSGLIQNCPTAWKRCIRTPGEMQKIKLIRSGGMKIRHGDPGATLTRMAARGMRSRPHLQAWQLKGKDDTPSMAILLLAEAESETIARGCNAASMFWGHHMATRYPAITRISSKAWPVPIHFTLNPNELSDCSAHLAHEACGGCSARL